MLTDQERINNALKEMLSLEEALAKKYAYLNQHITEPKVQQMLQGMEQTSRAHHKMLSDQMSSHGIA